MQSETIRRRMAEIRAVHGVWNAHNIHLGDGVYTMEDAFTADEVMLRRFVQAVADAVGRPLAELRVLDLACHEGMYGIEFARQGAAVVGIEGREMNLAKARFVKEVLGLERLEFQLDDVRNLRVERHGLFDVVLCSGILYHLTTPDVFEFLENIARCCTRLAVFNTQVSTAPRVAVTHRDRQYHGHYFYEHLPENRGGVDESATWASLDNSHSFWFTRPSLANVLSEVGFTTVADCIVPGRPGQRADWVTWLAFKGERQRILSSPRAEAMREPVQPERAPRLVHPGQHPLYPLARRLRPLLPDSLIRALAKLQGIGWARQR
jgi:2-polyprenyl-3-methyl-5-hydroxy-6-metoxy-1,4-benzoquinol methylase